MMKTVLHGIWVRVSALIRACWVIGLMILLALAATAVFVEIAGQMRRTMGPVDADPWLFFEGLDEDLIDIRPCRPVPGMGPADSLPRP